MLNLVLFYLIGKEIDASELYWFVYALYFVFWLVNLVIN